LLTTQMKGPSHPAANAAVPGKHHVWCNHLTRGRGCHGAL
jgi:hypothetical protein